MEGKRINRMRHINSVVEYGPSVQAQVVIGLYSAVLMCCLFFLAPDPAWAGRSWWGRVIRVVDGDTLEISKNGTSVLIDLVEVDAPELSQPFGPEAAESLRALIKGCQVRVAVRGRDNKGRLRGDVFSRHGLSLSLHLLEFGHAWWDRISSPGCRLCRHEEIKARQSKKGLWALPDPVPPWEWRNRENRSDELVL